MRKLIGSVCCAVGIAAAAGVIPQSALSAEEGGVDLTVYNQGFAVVKDRRSLELREGTQEIKFADIASGIEPTSVHFQSLTAPEALTVLEQNYEYDLVGSGKLLSKYIGKKIKVLAAQGSAYEGTLLSFDTATIVLSSSLDGSLQLISRGENILTVTLDELPEGLITRPTLVWKLTAARAGRQLTEVSYITSGISWACDYVAVINGQEAAIDLGGWVTLDNKSGAAYRDAGLKLIAGDVRRAPQPSRQARAHELVADFSMKGAQFEEKSFFEYHLYTLGRRVDVKDNQTKQVVLLEAAGVPVRKIYSYDPAMDYGWPGYQESESSGEQKVKVKLELLNSKENSLGMPLPKGTVKVYKRDTDGKLEFIGEDAIAHTPKDEKVKLYLGDAFDVVGERARMNYKQYGKTADETVVIKLRNHKDEDVEITVTERLWRSANWTVTAKSHEFKKIDAGTIEFKVPVAKSAETVIEYTVHYNW